jgi:hypothetical protein
MVPFGAGIKESSGSFENVAPSELVSAYYRGFNVNVDGLI